MNEVLTLAIRERGEREQGTAIDGQAIVTKGERDGNRRDERQSKRRKGFWFNG